VLCVDNKRMKKIIFLIAILSTISSTTAQAGSLGVVGPTYQIIETDLLKLIESTVQAKVDSGEWAKMQKNSEKRVRNTIENPKPIAGITTAETARTFYYDPSIVADKTYTDGNGRIVVAAGTKVNPLDHINMSKHLLFFDARDKAQKAKAHALYAFYKGRIKLILTGGSYAALMREWEKDDIRIYYDQHGTLTTKFGIQHVPALVSQEGKRLRIDELAL